MNLETQDDVIVNVISTVLSFNHIHFNIYSPFHGYMIRLFCSRHKKLIRSVNRFKQPQTPSVENHDHLPRMVNCAIFVYVTITCFT